MAEQTIQAKFGIGDMLPTVITLGVIGIASVYTISVTADVRDDLTNGTAEYEAANKTVEALAKFPDKLGLIVTVIVAALIIGILVRYFLYH